MANQQEITQTSLFDLSQKESCSIADLAERKLENGEFLVRGVVTGITAHKPDTGWFAATFTKVGDNSGETFRVTGKCPKICEGETIVFRGTFGNTKWGMQYNAKEAYTYSPTSDSGLIRYFAGKAIKGVGPAMAEKLIKHFGTAKAFLEAVKKPDGLKGVKGLGAAKRELIASHFAEDSNKRDLTMYLSQFGLTQQKIAKVIETFGEKSINKIRKNPYILCSLVGVGFKRADSFALASGILLDDENRIYEGLQYVLAEETSKGNCGIPLTAFRLKASKLLRVDNNIVEQGIKKLIDSKKLIQDSVSELKQTESGLEVLSKVSCLFPAKIYHNEKYIAKFILQAANQYNPAFADLSDEQLKKLVEQAIASRKSPIIDDQIDAVFMALRYRLFILTGGPGTGKTTTVNVILEAYKLRGLRIAACAPSGKAAKRMKEATGVESATVHRLLGWKGSGFEFKEDNKLKAQVVVCDEFSMMDVEISKNLMAAIDSNTAMLIVGDKDQLASVGSGRVLRDCLASGKIKSLNLVKTRRVSDDSGIIYNAKLVNEGIVPSLDYKGQSGDTIFCAKNEWADGAILDLISKQIDYFTNKAGYNADDIQVLSLMKEGQNGVKNYNYFLQKKLNPNFGNDSLGLVHRRELDQNGDESDTKLRYLYVGDRVMQVKNNYDDMVFNGDIGFVVSVNKLENSVIVEFDSDSEFDKVTNKPLKRQVTYNKDNFLQLELAYAMTVHKSQGSEMPVIIMVVLNSHYMLLQRNAIYTGMTRPRGRLVVITEPKAMRIAVKNVEVQERYSMLYDHLVGNTVLYLNSDDYRKDQTAEQSEEVPEDGSLAGFEGFLFDNKL